MKKGWTAGLVVGAHRRGSLVAVGLVTVLGSLTLGGCNTFDPPPKRNDGDEISTFDDDDLPRPVGVTSPPIVTTLGVNPTTRPMGSSTQVTATSTSSGAPSVDAGADAGLGTDTGSAGTEASSATDTAASSESTTESESDLSLDTGTSVGVTQTSVSALDAGTDASPDATELGDASVDGSANDVGGDADD